MAHENAYELHVYSYICTCVIISETAFRCLFTQRLTDPHNCCNIRQINYEVRSRGHKRSGTALNHPLVYISTPVSCASYLHARSWLRTNQRLGWIM